MELLNSKIDHPDYQCDHTAWGVELCKRVGSPTASSLLYDIYHMQIMEGDVIRTMRDNVRASATSTPPAIPGATNSAPTQEMNYKAIAKAIADLGYQGYIGHEYSPMVKPVRAALDEALAACNV